MLHKSEMYMFRRIAVVTVVVLVLMLAAAIAWIKPRNLIGWWRYGRQARPGTLQVGDTAPDVPLVELDGVTPRSLSEWIGDRPLVLVFGSFT